MKAINKIFLSLGIGAVALSMGSCVGDLDLTPTDQNVIVSGSPDVTSDAVMAGVFMNFATSGINGDSPISINGGFGTFQRALFSLEVIPTDEAYWYTGDADYSNFCLGVWSSTNGITNAAYRRLKVNIAACNSFLEDYNNGIFANEDQAKVKDLVRQAHVLRGVCYFYLIDLFGNVPWIGPDMDINTKEIPQLTRKEVFDNIVAELEAVVAEYNGDATQYYGYVGLEVAEAYLMKLYLNAEVYTGEPQWDNAIKYAENIIARHQGQGLHGLNPSYTQLFCQGNKTLSNGGGGACSEIIWAIPADAEKLQSWANGTLLIAGWCGSNNKDDFNFDQSAWNCMAIRPEAAKLFTWRDANGNYTTDLNNACYTDDPRTTYWLTVKDECDYTVENYGKLSPNNGFGAVKYTNWVLDDNGAKVANQPAATKMCGADYAMVRLAEVYLSAAEAYLKKGNQAKADEYVGYIRERAGYGVGSVSGVSMDQILDERCRELYTELNRRTDLIRFGKWISGYNWTWKNQVKTGADFPAYYNLYPLPYSELSDNPTYTQNQGYN